MKHEKIKLENSKNIFVSKCCPWAKTSNGGQVMVILPKMVKCHFLLNSKPGFCY